MRFVGKIALVTGASRGIGRSIATALAAEGATVVCTARTLEDSSGRGSLSETVSAIRDLGGAGYSIQCDVTVPTEVESVVTWTEETLGGIDFLVNNAGLNPRFRIIDMDPDDWDQCLNTNLTGPFLFSRYALPGMMRRRTGKILNITSDLALSYAPEVISYATAKYSLNRFTVNLAEEVRDYNVAVNALAPGRIQTEMSYGGRGGGASASTAIPPVLWILGRDESEFTGNIVSKRNYASLWEEYGSEPPPVQPDVIPGVAFGDSPSLGSELYGKVVIATGSSRGIGRVLALTLAKEGATVICVARTKTNSGDRGSLDQTVLDIANAGGKAEAVVCDVTDPRAVRHLVSHVEKNHGKIDVLINNVGIYPESKIHDMDPVEWESNLKTNLTSVFLMCHYALPGMAARGAGNIVNVSSGAASLYIPDRIAYSALKDGVNRFTRNLAQEVRDSGIAVNAISPVRLQTEMTGYTGEPLETVIEPTMWLIRQTVHTCTGYVLPQEDFPQ